MKKLYYSIGEVSRILNVEQHILRYWEKEFVLLKTKKNRAGNRVYSAEDLQFLKLIKHLLDEKKLSIKQVNQLFEIYKSKTEIINNYDNIIKGFTVNTKPIKTKKNIENVSSEKNIEPQKKNEILTLFEEIMDILKS